MSEPNRNALDRAEKFLSEGKFDEAQQIVENLEKKGDLTPDDQLKCQLVRCTLLYRRGHFIKAFNLARDSYRKCQKLGKLLQGVDALNTMSAALWRQGKTDEALALIVQAEQILDSLDEGQKFEILLRRSNLIYRKFTVYFYIGDLDRALQHAELSLILRKKLDSKPAIIHSLNAVGAVYLKKSDSHRAMDYFKQALVLLEMVGNKQDLARALNNIGRVYHDKGDFNRALEYLERSLTLKEGFGNKPDIARTLNNIGNVYWYKGDFNRALEYLERSLTLKEGFGNKLDIINSLDNIGKVYHSKGDLNRALEYHERSLELHKEIDNKSSLAKTLNYIGKIYWERGDLDLALEYHEESLSIQERINNRREIGVALESIGIIYWNKDNLDQASEYLKQSLALRVEIGDNWHTSRTLFYLISVALDRISLEEAQRYLERLQDIDLQEENKVINRRSRVAEALVLKTSVQAQDRIRARELLEHVVEEEVVDHNLTVLSLINVCDLWLSELETTHVQENLQAVQTYISKLLTIAQQQRSHWLLAGTYILQAKRIFVELRVSEAFEKRDELEQSLRQAYRLAQEKKHFPILSQTHGLLALFYSSQYLFDKAERELQKARAIIEKKRLYKEHQNLEKMKNAIQNANETYTELFSLAFEESQKDQKLGAIEKQLTESLDGYLQIIQKRLLTLIIGESQKK